MNQKDAEGLGYRLLKGSPLSEEARSYVESSLPYILKRYYDAGYEVVPRFKPNITMGEIEKMKEDGVIY